MPALRRDDALLRLTKEMIQIRAALRSIVGNIPLFDLSSQNTPAQITGDQNNYAIGDYDLLRLSSDAARTITGLAEGLRGRYLRLFNVGAFTITLSHESGSSAAANRFKFSSGFDHSLLAGGVILLYYDDVQSRWVDAAINLVYPNDATKYLSGVGTWSVVNSGDFRLIQDQLLAAPAASIDFQNIPATYKHLKIAYKVRSSLVVVGTTLGGRFNNDSGNNYDALRFRVSNAGLSPVQALAQSSMQFAAFLGASSAANKWSVGEIFFPDYTSVNNDKSLVMTGGNMTAESSGNINFEQGLGYWRTENAAISRITFIDVGGGNFISGSRMTLYGMA